MDNLAPSLSLVDPSKEDERVTVNAAFYRKLTQQIVQKDNIIKLLRLQVEETSQFDIGGSRDSTNASGEASSSAIDHSLLDKLNNQISELQSELATERHKLRTLLREDGFSKEEQLELTEQLHTYKNQVAGFEKDEEKLQSELSDLTNERDNLSHRLVDLSEKYNELLDIEVVSPEVVKDLELKIANSTGELKTLESENKRLHKRLVEAKTEITSSAEAVEQLQEQLETANRKLSSLPEFDRIEQENENFENQQKLLTNENDHLKSRLKSAIEKLEESRKEGSRKFSQSDWRILSGVILMYDSILQLSESLPESSLEEAVFAVFEALNLKKIETTGKFFDSALHDEIDIVYSSDHKHNLIIGEKSSGYISSGAVIKTAEVVVSKNPYWCSKCEVEALDKSSFCSKCGESLDKPDLTKHNDIDGQAGTFVALGRVCEKAMDFTGALSNYEKACAVMPTYRYALQGKARIYELLGNWEGALTAYVAILEQGPLNASENRGQRRVELKCKINDLVKDLF